MYVRKDYLYEGLFKLDVIVIANYKSSCFAYVLEFTGLWHEHLTHVNYKTLHNMASFDVCNI